MKEIGKKVLEPYMSPVMAVAFSIGSAIGWGSLVVTSSGYLGKAGYDVFERADRQMYSKRCT